MFEKHKYVWIYNCYCSRTITYDEWYAHYLKTITRHFADEFVKKGVGDHRCLRIYVYISSISAKLRIKDVAYIIALIFEHYEE